VRLINFIFSEVESFYIDIENKEKDFKIVIVVKDEIYNKFNKNASELYNSVFNILEILLYKINIKKMLFLEIKKF
jgi:hypothetical protein